MVNTVRCDCGVELDISGMIPKKDGIKVHCVVCGTTKSYRI